MDLSMSSTREDPFASDNIFAQQDLPIVPNDNPETYCRLCLTTPDVVPLFPPGTDPNVYILELIGQYIGVGLTMEDDASCAVCTSCQLILDQFDLFRQNCLKVDIAIRRKRLGLDRMVKSEPQDDEEEDLDLPYKRLDNRSYQCRVCSETFRSMSLFMGHCKEKHPDEAKMYKCKHCTKSFMTKTARLQHIRSHQPTNAEGDLGVIRMQVCEKCMITFESYKLLKDHIKEHHSSDPKQETLICSTCSRQFSRITILRNHILRVHLGKQPHVCKQCKVAFAYSQQLVAHLKVEHGISPDEFGQFAEDHLDDEEGAPHPITEAESDPATMDDTAPETESQPVNPQNSTELNDRSMKNINRYACIDCSVKCGSTEELRNHRKIHQDPTWWKCNNCRNLVKHQQMHLQKKHPTISESEIDSSFTIRYRCWMCRMYFKTLHQMEVHANVKHQIPLPEHHQVAEPSDELEEGEIRPDVRMQPPPSTLIHAAAAGLPSVIPQPLTAQAALPFAPEHFPMLLSQLENGALDYLREFSKLIDPNNQLGLAAQLDIKPNVAALNASMAMDLSGNSALNLSNFTSAVNSTRNSDGSIDVADDESESEDDTFIRLDNRTYQCKFCPEIIRHMQLMRKHTKMQHPSEWKSFKCVHCKRRFPSAPIRDRHTHFHRLDHPCKCTECDQMYNSQKRLEKHFQIFHDRNSHSFSLERFKCGSCEMTFVEKKYYDLHSRIYHEKKPQRLKNLSEKIQVCERCFTKFDSRELLMDHIRQKHQGDPPLKNCVCTTCHKDLKTITLLRIHIMVVHMGISPFVCQHCNADFPSRHWLLKHMEKEHAEIALFKCHLCDDSFTTEARLIEHKDKVHTEVVTEYDAVTGTIVYPCTKCDKKLASKELLEKHLIKAHPSFMMMYKCPLCTQPIRYRKQHMQVHHKIEYDPKEHQYQLRYKCHCCSKLFQQKRNLLSHQNSLSYQCSRCQMRFKTKKNLQAHMSAHKSNKCLKCEDCGLDFGYRARLETHRQRYHSPTSTRVLKIINCPYCPKLFISKSNRERHIAANHVHTEFKVNCNHCQVQVTDTAQLRKHYKTVHPEDRVTFKCPACERFYLNLSSFKDHYKKHKEEADKSSNSTVDGSEADADMSPDKATKIKQEVQLDADTKAIEVKQEITGVYESSQEKINEVKQEFENGSITAANCAATGSHKLGDPTLVESNNIKSEEVETDNIDSDVQAEQVESIEQAAASSSADQVSSEPKGVEQLSTTVGDSAKDTVQVSDNKVKPILEDKPREENTGLNQVESSQVAELGVATTDTVINPTVATNGDTAVAVEEKVVVEKEDSVAPASSEPTKVENTVVEIQSTESKLTIQTAVAEKDPVTSTLSEPMEEENPVVKDESAKTEITIQPVVDKDDSVELTSSEPMEVENSAVEVESVESESTDQKLSSEHKENDSTTKNLTNVNSEKEDAISETLKFTEETKQVSTAEQTMATDTKVEPTAGKLRQLETGSSANIIEIEKSSESEPDQTHSEIKQTMETNAANTMESSEGKLVTEETTMEMKVNAEEPLQEPNNVSNKPNKSDTPAKDELASKEGESTAGKIERQIEVVEADTSKESPEEQEKSEHAREEATTSFKEYLEEEENPEKATTVKQKTVKQYKQKAKLARTNELNTLPVETKPEEEIMNAEEVADSLSSEIKTSPVNNVTLEEEKAEADEAKQDITSDLLLSGEQAKTEERKVDVEAATDPSESKTSPIEEVKTSDVEEAIGAPSSKSSERKKQQGTRPIRKNLKQSRPKRVGKRSKVKQKVPDKDIDSGVSINESEMVVGHLEQDTVLENNEVLSETASLRDDVPQVASSSSSHADKNESKDAASVEPSKTDNAQGNKNKTEKTNPHEADVPSDDNEQNKNDPPPESSEKYNHVEAVLQKSETKQLEDCRTTTDESDVTQQTPEPGHSATEKREESPVKSETTQNEFSPPEENSKDGTQPSENNRSTNNSPTSTAVDSPFTIMESSNDASEISEASSVTSERSSLKRKATPASEGRRISTRNVHKRKKRLMVLLDPVDVDRLMELSRGSSVSPSLDRITRKGSVSTTGSSSESQPAREDQMPAKRLRRERRTPNPESSSIAGDS